MQRFTRTAVPRAHSVRAATPPERLLSTARMGLIGYHPPKAALGPSAIQPALNPLAPSFFPSTHAFSAAEVETVFQEGQLALGAPRRFDALFLEGTAYSQNYAYDLTYNGRVIAVLHVHYNTNTASEVRNTATVGASKIKASDFGATLSYNPSPGLIAAARALH